MRLKLQNERSIRAKLEEMVTRTAGLIRDKNVQINKMHEELASYKTMFGELSTPNVIHFPVPLTRPAHTVERAPSVPSQSADNLTRVQYEIDLELYMRSQLEPHIQSAAAIVRAKNHALESLGADLKSYRDKYGYLPTPELKHDTDTSVIDKVSSQRTRRNREMSHGSEKRGDGSVEEKQKDTRQRLQNISVEGWEPVPPIIAGNSAAKDIYSKASVLTQSLDVGLESTEIDTDIIASTDKENGVIKEQQDEKQAESFPESAANVRAKAVLDHAITHLRADTVHSVAAALTSFPALQVARAVFNGMLTGASAADTRDGVGENETGPVHVMELNDLVPARVRSTVDLYIMLFQSLSSQWHQLQGRPALPTATVAFIASLLHALRCRVVGALRVRQQSLRCTALKFEIPPSTAQECTVEQAVQQEGEEEQTEDGLFDDMADSSDDDGRIDAVSTVTQNPGDKAILSASETADTALIIFILRACYEQNTIISAQVSSGLIADLAELATYGLSTGAALGLGISLQAALVQKKDMQLALQVLATATHFASRPIMASALARAVTSERRALIDSLSEGAVVVEAQGVWSSLMPGGSCASALEKVGLVVGAASAVPSDRPWHCPTTGIHAQVLSLLGCYDNQEQHNSRMQSTSVQRAFAWLCPTSPTYAAMMQNFAKGDISTLEAGNSMRDVLSAELRTHWEQELTKTASKVPSIKAREFSEGFYDPPFARLIPNLRTALAAYDGASLGWRLTAVGTSQQLHVRLQHCMRVVRRVVQEIAGLDGLPPGPLLSTRVDVEQTPLSHVLRTTSMSPAGLAEACLALDACSEANKFVQAAIETSKYENMERLPQLQQQLHSVMTHMADIVSCTWLECICYLISASANACLQVCESKITQGGLLPLSQLASIATDAFAMCRYLPVPWGLITNAQTATLALRVVSKLQHVSSSPQKTLVLPSFNNEILNLSHCVPAFIISLERRPDRWRAISQLSAAAGLLTVPVRAVDGQLLGIAETSAIQGILAPVVAEALLHGVQAAVRPTWDSTLNRRYDPQCFQSTEVPMTYSERACAASHVKVWRHIADLRQQLFGVYADATSVVAGRATGLHALESSVSDCDTTRDTAQAAFRLTLAGGGWQPYASSGLPLLPGMSGGVDPDSDWYLILEDDAVLSPRECPNPADFSRLLSETLLAVPEDWDLLYLGYAANPRGRGPSVKGSAVPMFKALYLWHLHAYVVRGRSITKLLAQLPVNCPVDNFLASLTYGEILVGYARYAPLLVQPGTISERQASSDVRHSARDVVAGNKRLRHRK